MASTGDIRKITKNALLHGVYASEFLLPWEDRQVLLDLHHDLMAEWEPDTATAREAVSCLTRAIWLKRRAVRAAQIAALREPYAHEIAASGQKSWSGIRRFLKEESDFDGDARLLNSGVIAVQAAELRRQGKKLLERDLDDKERTKIQEESKRVVERLERVVKLKGELEAHQSAEKVFNQAYDPHDMERVVRLEAMLDARIDKCIARLVNLKEYSRLMADRESKTKIPSLPQPDEEPL